MCPTCLGESIYRSLKLNSDLSIPTWRFDTPWTDFGCKEGWDWADYSVQKGDSNPPDDVFSNCSGKRVSGLWEVGLSILPPLPVKFVYVTRSSSPCRWFQFSQIFGRRYEYIYSALADAFAAVSRDHELSVGTGKHVECKWAKFRRECDLKLHVNSSHANKCDAL